MSKKESSLRKLIEKMLKKEIAKLPVQRILNAGERKGLYRGLFQGKHYITIDKLPGADITADLEELSGLNDTYDLIMCISVLEHTPNPAKVISELSGLLEPGGYFFLSVPFLYHIHGAETYGDYWRFTPDGIRQLMKGYQELWINMAKDKSGSVALFRKEVNREAS